MSLLTCVCLICERILQGKNVSLPRIEFNKRKLKSFSALTVLQWMIITMTMLQKFPLIFFLLERWDAKQQ